MVKNIYINVVHNSQQIWNFVKLEGQNDKIHKDIFFRIFGVYEVNLIFPSKNMSSPSHTKNILFLYDKNK